VIKLRRMRCVGHVARMGVIIAAYKVLIGKHEGMRPLRRRKRKWDDNIRIDVREIE
jgi:hypothetical protein